MTAMVYSIAISPCSRTTTSSHARDGGGGNRRVRLHTACRKRSRVSVQLCTPLLTAAPVGAVSTFAHRRSGGRNALSWPSLDVDVVLIEPQFMNPSALRNVRHVCDDGQRGRLTSLETVRSDTSCPTCPTRRGCKERPRAD